MKKRGAVVLGLAVVGALGWGAWTRYVEWEILQQLESEDRATWTVAAEQLLDEGRIEALPAIMRVIHRHDRSEKFSRPQVYPRLHEWRRRLYEVFPYRCDSIVPVLVESQSHENEDVRFATRRFFE